MLCQDIARLKLNQTVTTYQLNQYKYYDHYNYYIIIDTVIAIGITITLTFTVNLTPEQQDLTQK